MPFLLLLLAELLHRLHVLLYESLDPFSSRKIEGCYLVDAILKRSIAETVDIVVLQLFRIPFFGYKFPLQPIGSCCFLFRALLRRKTKELDSVLPFVDNS